MEATNNCPCCSIQTTGPSYFCNACYRNCWETADGWKHRAESIGQAKVTFASLAAAVAELVETKNKAYGSSFAKCNEFLKLLYPDGVPVEKYGDMLTIVRVFDKLMRIATDKDALGESPWRDITGYALLALKEEQT